MAGDVDDDGAVVVVGVQRVEHVAELDVDPADVGVAAVARHHADARAVLGFHSAGNGRWPSSSKSKTTGRSKNTTLRSVITKSCTIDGPAMSMSSVRTSAPSRRRRGTATTAGPWVVAEEEQLARDRVELRVRGHRRAELAAEVVAADRGEVGAHLGREAHLDECEDLARVRDDVRVRDAQPTANTSSGWPGIGSSPRRSSTSSVRTQRFR